MRFEVRELRFAREDINSIFTWLSERSSEGALSWLDAYDRAIDGIRQRATSHGLAPESGSLGVDIRQALFKTRRGRYYRVVFYVDEEVAYVLRVRGPGQQLLRGRDLNLP